MSVKLNYSFGQNTQLGKDKEFNTDAILDFPVPDGHVFLVCDGHDGDAGHGALAAKLVAESIKKYFFNKNYKDVLNALTNAVTFANFTLYEQGSKDAKYKNIGSTIAILVYKSNKVYYAYAGDSRIYMHKDDKLKALTLDHVEDRYNASESEVNILLGREKDIKFGVCKTPLEIDVNDKFVLCTDGLTDVVSTDEISEIIKDDNTSPDHKSLLLMQKVDENKGAGNASVQVVEFDNNHPVAKSKTKMGRLLKVLAIVIVALGVFAYGGYKAYEYFSTNSFIKSENDVESIIPQEEENKEIEQDNTQLKYSIINDENISESIEDKTEELKPEPIKKKVAKSVQLKEQVYHHKVEFGENLYRLSLRYGVTQDQLKKLNGNKAINLIAGYELKVPVKAVHTVKMGESYSVLSDMYNMKIDIICRANKLDKNQPLSEGKTIVIPLK